MSEKRTTTSESRRKSRDKQSEAKKRLDNQRRSGETINKVMKQVADLGTTGFSDTDQNVMQGAEKIGRSAERVGQEDAKSTSIAEKDLSSHGTEMEKISKKAASEGTKADNIHSSDKRLASAQELRSKYKEAESVASDLGNVARQKATETRVEAKTLLDRVKSSSRKRPSFR